MLSAKRDTKAAKRFFKKVLKAKYNKQPRVINVDKNAAYPPAIEQLKKQKDRKHEGQRLSGLRTVHQSTASASASPI